MEINKFVMLCFFTLISLSSFITFAAETLLQKSDLQEPKKFIEQVKSLQKNNIKYYQSDNKTNQIPYFDNRFRIDSTLDEITMIFFRRRGSRPIVLVRPDGSKLRLDNIDPDKEQWHDDSTFDLIKIKKPMPGPWQAIGQILPESQIMVLSEVRIEVTPLPDDALAGEILKVTGKLYNDDKPINTPHFRNVVKLDVNFYSTNNTDYENFGASALKLTSFFDDGKGLDEYAGDGLFTGDFHLDFAAGQWQPIFLIKLPMATRELRQKPFVLHKSPINIDVETSEDENQPHHMTLSINPAYVEPDTLIFQGKVTFPDKTVESFSIMDDQKGATRLTEIKNTESGIYRIDVTAFGKTTTGREFRLTVPEYSFNVKAKVKDNEVLVTTVDENGIEQTVSVDRAEKLLADRAAELAEAKIIKQKEEAEKKTQTIIMIVVGNSLIIIVALVLFFVMRMKKNSTIKSESSESSKKIKKKK